MSSNNIATTPLEKSAGRLMGRVKWFNNKAGYGFITISEGAQSGTDIFVHHSAIKVSSQQYKYLVQGEYVEFTLVSTEGGTHAFQAADISGIAQGKLMCETRKELLQNRSNHKNNDYDGEGTEEFALPRSRKVNNSDESFTQAPRARGEGPRENWTEVKKRDPTARESTARESTARESTARESSAKEAPSRGRGRPPRSNSTLLPK